MFFYWLMDCLILEFINSHEIIFLFFYFYQTNIFRTGNAKYKWVIKIKSIKLTNKCKILKQWILFVKFTTTSTAKYEIADRDLDNNKNKKTRRRK